MPKPRKGPRMGSGPAHQKAMISTLAKQLIIHERIKTTQTKANVLRPTVEKLITLGKKGDLNSRRTALKTITDKTVVHKLFDKDEGLAGRFANREGGYTRIVKLGPRPGDAAPMVIIEFVE